MNQGKGTTNIGFKIRDGIIVGTESRITSNKIILSDTKEKFRELSSSSSIYCTLTGKVLVWDSMCLHVQKKIKDEELSLNGRTTAFFASEKVLEHLKLRGEECRHDDRDVTFGTIICGWNEAKRAYELYEAHLVGETSWRRECDKAVALGTGAKFIKDRLEGNVDYDNISIEDAADWGLKLLFAATVFDKFSGGTMHVFYVHKNGYVEIHNVDPLEVCSRYYAPYSLLHEIERRTILLLYHRSTCSPISEDDLMKLGPNDVIVAAHHVAKTRDFYFHRVICVSEEVASRILEFIDKSDHHNEGESRFSPRLNGFICCELVVNGKRVQLYVQRSSMELVQSICEMPGDIKINEQLRPSIMRLPPD